MCIGCLRAIFNQGNQEALVEKMTTESRPGGFEEVNHADICRKSGPNGRDSRYKGRTGWCVEGSRQFSVAGAKGVRYRVEGCEIKRLCRATERAVLGL